MRALLVLSFLVPAVAAEPDLPATVWAAADAIQKDYPATLRELEAHPRADWRKVWRILAAGREYLAKAPKPLIDDADALRARFVQAGFKRRGVRRHDLGPDASYWYGYRLPEGNDGGTPVPVYLGLNSGSLERPAPAGWALVVLNWNMITAAQTAKIPMSMTAGRAFQSYLLSVIADLERRFNVDRDRIFLGGYSRAGNSAWYHGVHWPDLWAGILPVSGYYKTDAAMWDNLRNTAIFAAHGGDRMHRAANDFTARLARKLKGREGFTVELLKAKGRGVDPPFWTKAWAWMGDRKRDPLPPKVRYALFDAAHRGAFWLEIVKVKSTGGVQVLSILAPGGVVTERVPIHRKGAWVEAEITGRNEIDIRANNVAALKLHLSPERFDLDRPVTVRVGRRSREHTPEPSIATLMASFRRDRDRRRLFPAEILVRP